jgi:FtsZ-binding cell division protein ZapB
VSDYYLFQEQRCKQYEEKIRLLQQSKDETQSHANMLSGTVQDLQSKNSSLILENEALKRKIDSLQNVGWGVFQCYLFWSTM